MTTHKPLLSPPLSLSLSFYSAHISTSSLGVCLSLSPCFSHSLSFPVAVWARNWLLGVHTTGKFVLNVGTRTHTHTQKYSPTHTQPYSHRQRGTLTESPWVPHKKGFKGSLCALNADRQHEGRTSRRHAGRTKATVVREATRLESQWHVETESMLHVVHMKRLQQVESRMRRHLKRAICC